MSEPTALVANPQTWDLPKVAADDIQLASPYGAMLLIRGAIRGLMRRGSVIELPPQFPGRRLPSYLLQEFHGVPNGYYSTQLSRSYARGFELVMLGRMRGARRRMAEHVVGAHPVLDVGCGAGALARAMREAGATDIVGFDPSPYSLKLASAEVPGATFFQAIAEETGLPDAHFGGAGACFVFHELPAAAADRAIAELRRVLKPGAKLAITEPSPVHIKQSVWRLLSKGYWLGPWYRGLARLVYEPYLNDWLDRDVPGWLKANGFTLLQDTHGVPFREIVAQRD